MNTGYFFRKPAGDYKLKGAGHDCRAYVTDDGLRDFMIARGVSHVEIWERHYRASYGRKTFTKHVVFPLAEIEIFIKAGEGDWSWVVPFNGPNGGNDWMKKLTIDGRTFNVGSITASAPTMADCLAALK